MIVLVTGATAGFGECITRRFIENGHKVIATGRRQERLQELKDELGNNLYIAQLDVRNRASIEEMLDTLPAEWRNIDIWSTMPVWRWVLSQPTKRMSMTGKP